MGAIFPKELPGQESKAEIILNAKPSCWVLSQRPLSRPNYQAAGLLKVPVASLDVAVNCAALSTPSRICLMKSICGSRVRLGCFCGLIKDARLLAKMFAHDFNRLQQVGIVRYHHGHIKAPHVGVV